MYNVIASVGNEIIIEKMLFKKSKRMGSEYVSKIDKLTIFDKIILEKIFKIIEIGLYLSV